MHTILLSTLWLKNVCSKCQNFQVEKDQLPVRAEASPRSDPVSNCLYRNRNHTLEDCQLLRWKPYPERIQFLTSKNLGFVCLSDQHVSRGKHGKHGHERMKFWIINASSVIRRVLSICFSCRRRQAPLCEQEMADLSMDRITPGALPFTEVGIDCFGPLQVRRGRSLVK